MHRRKAFAEHLTRFRENPPDFHDLVKMNPRGEELLAVRLLESALRRARTLDEIESALIKAEEDNPPLASWLEKTDPERAALATSFKERKC